MANWKDIQAREARRIEYEQELQKRLEALGVQFRVAHFTGDSSYPTEYTFRYSFVQAVGPTFDLALVEFIEKLLKHVPVEKALEQEAQQAEQPSIANINTSAGDKDIDEWLSRQPESEAERVRRYNAEMDERNRIIAESRDKPWLPMVDGGD